MSSIIVLLKQYEFVNRVIIFRVILDLCYINVLAHDYSYYGWDYSPDWFSIFVSWILLLCITFLINRTYRNDEGRASYEIVFVLFIISFIPFSSTVAFDRINIYFALFNSLYWFLIALICVVLRRRKEKLLFGLKYNNPQMILFIISVIMITIVVYISGIYAGFRLNFSLDNVYNLRAEAEAFQIPLVLRYLFAIAAPVNSILIVYFLKEKKYFWSAIIVLTQLLSFGVDGQKSTIGTMALAVFIGVLPSTKLVVYNRWILRAVTIIALGALSLYKAFRYLTPVSLFVRRLLFLPVKLSELYVVFFWENEPDYFRQSFLRHFGASSSYDNISKMIGDLLLKDSHTSANNGMISDAFTNLGVVGVFIYPLLYLLIFAILDRVMPEKNSNMYIIISLYFGLTLTNSFLGTSLLTHGLVILLFIMTIIKSIYMTDNRGV